ncbi:MAG: hypothetical protein KC425_20350, partial [Anaerolineales bacterium]|nr:hypothetical protein [Anaerolineales bacterium]
TWLPGEIVVDRRTIPIQPDAAPGEVTLAVGLYTVENGRLPVTRDGAPQPNDQLPLATVMIRE